jgi:LPXTG-site transpeptidase (sortase) family protein
VAARVVPIAASGRTLVPPSDPRELGWWSDGARPGADRGSALITGHTVHTGGGALDDLEQLRRGDPVTVRTDRGTVHYVVRRVRTYSKGAIAGHAGRLFDQHVAGRLVLVTCEDWDGQRFLSNVVVNAAPRAP